MKRERGTEVPALSFRILGMDCAEEVAVLKREVGPLVGGEGNLAFDVLSGRMHVWGAVEASHAPRIREAVARAGMTAEPLGAALEGAAEGASGRRRARALATVASGAATAAGLAAHALLSGGLRAALHPDVGAGTPAPAAGLYALGVLAGLAFVAPKAWLALRRLRPDMNLLMTIAVLGAVSIGQWLEASTVSFLFALSLAIEAWSVGRARNAVAKLLDLSPARARVSRGGRGEEMVPVEDVEVGTAVIVRPGERIPLDGRIAMGATAVDESPITGESVPAEKGTGDEVFAGTINGDGAITITTLRPARETVLARITRMVGEAQHRRAPVERWVDEFARVYTPSVMALAAASLLFPTLVLGLPWGTWIYRSLTLLVIACPCALVISTPVSIVAALASAARHGVLVKGGAFVELPAKLRAVALDKTGTVTEGRQRVIEVLGHGGADGREALERVAALEARSEHPIGRAIVEHASTLGIRPAAAEEVRASRGKGITGRIGDRTFWAGSHRLLAERGADTPEVQAGMDAVSGPGRTVVVVGDERGVLGFVALADAVRPAAARVVAELRAEGIGRVVLLTGDNRSTAERVAREVGADEVLAELLPEDKVGAVESLVRRHGRVAMVGDGVNDAPAMARADLGIAMGAAGSDAAIEAADVALMSDDLEKIPWLIRHSRRTLGIVRQNIAFSLAVKGAFVALTFAGFASLWAAIAADMGASLLVIGNGLRLLRR